MKAVVFDLDGVVVDSEQYWSEAEEEIYSKAIESGSVKPEELSGMSIQHTYEYISENFGAAISQDEFFKLYEDRAEEVYTEKAELMPGLKQLMEDLRSRGLKIGLATGSYWPDYVIEHFDLDFDAVVHSGKIDGKGKPDPETYRMAVEKLGVSPEKAVAIDDTDAGIESASRAGLYCIGYSGSDGQSLFRADIVVEGPEELREKLFELV